MDAPGFTAERSLLASGDYRGHASREFNGTVCSASHFPVALPKLAGSESAREVRHGQPYGIRHLAFNPQTSYESSYEAICKADGLDYCPNPPRCVRLTRDESDCGQCGSICPYPNYCADGVCTCLNGGPLCHGGCCPRGSDCESYYAPILGPIHRCVCHTGLTECSTGWSRVCSDLSKDRNNCGGCGNVCPNSQFCCGGRCVDPSSDPNNCGSCWNVCPGNASCNGGICNCPKVANPDDGTGTNNYVLTSGCGPILGLKVTVRVLDNLEADGPFSFQLNGYSPATPGGTGPWQQYGFQIRGNDIWAWMQDWKDASSFVLANAWPVASTPIANGLPTGYALGVELINDATGNVVSARFSVVDEKGIFRANQEWALKDVGCNVFAGTGCIGFSSGDLAPITAFELNIVGPDNGEAVTFSIGIGSITYEALTPLTPNPSDPCSHMSPTLTTMETSNIAYKSLSSCEPRPIVQVWTTPEVVDL
jgi:hypothetical protein